MAGNGLALAQPRQSVRLVVRNTSHVAYLDLQADDMQAGLSGDGVHRGRV